MAQPSVRLAAPFVKQLISNNYGNNSGQMHLSKSVAFGDGRRK
jgi:hypothetical protein